MNAIYQVTFLINRTVIIINIYLPISGFFLIEEFYGFYGDSPHGSLHLPARFEFGYCIAAHNLSPAQSKL